MSLDLAADLDAMLDDELGVDVTIGAVTGRGILDITTELRDVDGVMQQVRVHTLRVRTGVFTLSDNQQVTAGGTTYRNHGWDLESDGKETVIQLSRRS